MHGTMSLKLERVIFKIGIFNTPPGMPIAFISPWTQLGIDPSPHQEVDINHEKRHTLLWSSLKSNGK